MTEFSTLRERITDVIRREGPIPFSRYMEMCLYEPGLGFYAREREVFGKAGDFYTSSDVHAVYGRLLCRQFDEMWRVLGEPETIDLVELGPGRGLFALDVLDWAAKKFSGFAAALRYRLVETSEYLRKRQAERLSHHVAVGRASIHASLANAEEKCGAALIVFGNEFFDALPVEVVTAKGQVYVDVDASGRFVEVTRAETPEIAEFIDRYGVRPEEDQRVEVALAGQSWVREIAALLKPMRRGFCVFVDYGYTRNEQLAGRHLDTLMTYRQHEASPDPYAAPGEQDITAHVNFTALRAAAEQSGMHHAGLLTQSQLLLGIGEKTQFGDALDECRLPQERAKVLLQLKHLVTPAGMGEIFHAMILSHGVAPEAALNLSGLSFTR